MQSRRAQMMAKAMLTYESAIAAIPRNLQREDLLKKAAAFWHELTGNQPAVSPTYMSVQMGKAKANGRYPTRAYDLQLLAEFIDDTGGDLLDFDAFKIQHDSSSTDLQWGGSGLHVSVWAYHGGNCVYEQVGTETIQQPIYEAKCND